MIEVLAAESGGAATSFEVRLQPLVTLSGRVLDDEGKPLTVRVLYLDRNVEYPDQSGRSSGTPVPIQSIPVATRKLIDKDGSYTFDQLIPGATYNTRVEVSGHATSTSKDVTIKPGQPVRLDDFRLPVTDQELKGVVVDPRGKPLDKVMVGYERTEHTNSLYAPTGAVWFRPTDGSGQFHLTGLPRGPIKLMVYRVQTGTDRSIQNIKHIDVDAGQDEVRIELPDPNDRLRAID